MIAKYAVKTKSLVKFFTLKHANSGISMRKTKILRNTLIENNEIVKDYAEAYLEAENITSAKEFQIIKAEPETPNLSTLETTILRYFKPCSEKNTLFKEVDFDLSKGKVLTTEQNDKFFNI